jgi:hypothetical protein
MKNLILLASLFISLQLGKKEKIEVPAMKSVELSYSEFASFDVNLSSTSKTPIDVSVIDPNTKKQVQGFGLGSYGNAVLSIKPEHILRLKNNSVNDMNLSIEFVERKPNTYNPENAPEINFTLHNSSLKSIPLIIPGVMNPNLSPMSNSGVTLKIGQKIYLRDGAKKVLILTVDQSIQKGDKIDMAKLVKDLKKD